MDMGQSELSDQSQLAGTKGWAEQFGCGALNLGHIFELVALDVVFIRIGQGACVEDLVEGGKSRVDWPEGCKKQLDIIHLQRDISFM